MKKKALEIIATGALVLGLLANPLTVGAQNAQDIPGNNQVPNVQNPGVVNDTNEGNSFDWRWLLPLLAIPLVLAFILRDEDDTVERTHTGRYATVGTKGGKAKKTRTETTEEVEEDDQ
jgi:hypothetical protein